MATPILADASVLRREWRLEIERAIEAALDVAHQLLAMLDDVDGDLDLEPDCDAEDDGTAEPALAARVTGDPPQLLWAGLDQGAAA